MKPKSYDPSARLQILRPVLAALKPGETVKGHDMAQIAQMSWQNFKATVIDKDPDLPVLFRGGMGVEWQFDAHAVIAHMVAGHEAQIARTNSTAARIAALAGIGPARSESCDGDRPPAMTSLEIKQTTEALMSQTRLRQMQGELVSRAAVADMLSELFSTLQGETLAFIGSHDPAGLLPPHAREAIMDHQRNLLVTLQDKAMATIDRLGERRAT